MDMPVRVAAVIFVPEVTLFNAWLGNKPLVRRSVDKLLEIRGIDFTCVVTVQNKNRKPPHVAESVLGGAALLFAPFSIDPLDDYATVRWLAWDSNVSEGLKAERFLVVHADKPLTPTAHIARVLDNALDHGDDNHVTLTGRPVEIGDPYNGTVTRFEPNRGAWACHRGFLQEAKPHWCRKFTAVSVGSVESLSVLDHDEGLAIQALVNQGHA